MKWLRLTTRFLLVFCLLTTVACRREALHQGLDEGEADEILALLHDNGINATKELEESNQNQVASWKIIVRQEMVPQARQILISHNLPRKKELGLSGVYKEKGLIPTPDEQKARFLLALKGEIINSLHKIPGVVDADVVLNVPDQSEFSMTDVIQKRPTASVIVRTTDNEVVMQTVTETKLQKFVANTVPNMDPNDVVVIISRTMTDFIRPPAPVAPAAPALTQNSPLPAADTVAGIRVERASAGRFKAYLAGFLVILMGVSGFLVFHVLKTNRARNQKEGVRSGIVPLAATPNPSLLGAQQAGDFGAAPNPAYTNTEGTF